MLRVLVLIAWPNLRVGSARNFVVGASLPADRSHAAIWGVSTRSAGGFTAILLGVVRSVSHRGRRIHLGTQETAVFWRMGIQDAACARLTLRRCSAIALYTGLWWVLRENMASGGQTEFAWAESWKHRVLSAVATNDQSQLSLLAGGALKHAPSPEILASTGMACW